MTNTILILEDEKYILQFLMQLISSHPLVTKVVGAIDSKQAILLSRECIPNIAFLDIELGDEEGWNGIDVARTIRSISPHTKLVFVTGYDRYALDSFQVHPYDYVLKPINPGRIMHLITALSKETKPATHQETDKLVIKTNNEVILINYSEIFYIEKQGNCTLIHTESDIYKASESLYELESLLPPRFLKSHKSFIVNLDRINRISDYNRSFELHFRDYDKVALMSRKQYKQLRHHFTPSLKRNDD